jgi:hypothetical protein
LQLRLDGEGATFVTAAGALGAGCEPGAPGVTIPALGARQDMGGIAWCARRIKAAFPNESELVLQAAGDVDYGVIINAMDALRGSPDAPVFAHVAFGEPL